MHRGRIRQQLQRNDQFTEIGLPPLSVHATHALATQIAGQSLTDQRAADLHEEMAGNPLFADCLANRINQNGFAGRFNDLSGADRGSPEFSGFLTAMYTQPLGNGLEMRLRGETSYVSSQNLNGALAAMPSFEQDAITLVNGSVGIGAEDGAWSLQLWGRNLTDETYYRGTFFSVGTVGPSTNSYPSNPRTYGLTLRARF